MRKVLLTSSQVSMLLTAAMVLLCAAALFFSGYAIQQRTLRDLRIAIRPRESPKIHLPEEFRNGLSQGDDGSIVVIETEAEQWAREARGLVRQVEPSEQDPEIQVEETAQEEAAPEPAPEAEEQSQETKGNAKSIPDTPNGEPTKEQLALLETIQKSAADKSWAVENPDPLSKNKAPLTRAERRRMIKQEIQRLSQAEKPIYYQRRLW